MENPQISWIVTFGMIGFWFIAPLIDLMRTPKTTSSTDRNGLIDRNDHTNRTDRTPAQGAYR